MTPSQPIPAPQSLRLSIALCTYNGARSLEEQLQSFAAQHRLPDELILSDDGSTDNTLALAEQFARTAAFPVRIVRNPKNLGYNRNFAQAIALCTGDIIALSDQDDLWYPQKLARLQALFLEHPEADGIFSDGDLIDLASNRLPGSLWGSFRFLPDDQQRLRSGNAVEVLLQRNVVTGMAFAFRRHWQNQLAEMPATWPHDAWLALLLGQQGKLLPCPEHLVAYRVHENQKIGVPITAAEKRRYLLEHGLGGYLALSRRRNQQEYQKDARQFADLLQLLENSPKPDLQQMLLPIQGRLEAKAEHARAGAALLDLGPAAPPPPRPSPQGVLRPLCAHSGAKAMIRDLVI